MFGKKPQLNPLTLRKELLIAESEINRAQLVEEWRTIVDGAHSLTHQVMTVSSVASLAGVLMAGVFALRRGKESTDTKTSWFQTALKGAQVVGSLWSAFRSRQK